MFKTKRKTLCSWRARRSARRWGGGTTLATNFVFLLFRAPRPQARSSPCEAALLRCTDEGQHANESWHCLWRCESKVRFGAFPNPERLFPQRLTLFFTKKRGRFFGGRAGTRRWGRMETRERFALWKVFIRDTHARRGWLSGGREA